MKKKLQHQLLKVVRYSFLGVFLQCSLTCVLLAGPGIGKSQHISIDKIYVSVDPGKVKIREAFNLLEQSTSLKFVYLNNSTIGKGYIEMTGIRRSLGDILRDISRLKKLAFRRVNDKIYVKKVEDSKNLPANMVQEVLEIDISGKVTDENGEGLPGASVLVKGSDIGTVTDSEGLYKLSVPDDATTLVFSFVGYLTEEVAIEGRTNIDVILTTDISQLSEVVVIGYGTQTKREVTGSIASISSKELGEVSVDGFSRALTGKVAGVRVQQTTGAPGGNITIRVRGTGSINADNEPLYVIDGFPVENTNVGASDQGINPLSSINPDDIESIEVLKDAAAASIYGSRGSNGVVIITTKRGEQGKAKINFDVSFGTQSVINKVDVLNGDDFLDLIGEAYANAAATNEPGLPPPDFLQNENQFRGINTDWQDEIFRAATVQNYQLSASGGSENLKYFISGGYLNEEGVVIASGFERFSFRTNLDAKLSDKVRLGLSFTPSYAINDEVNAEGHWASNAVINQSLIGFGFLRPDQDQEEFVNSQPNFNCCGVPNPVRTANRFDAVSTQFRVIANSFAEIDLMKGLTFKTSIGTDLNYFRRDVFNPADIRRNQVDTEAEARNLSQRSWLSENTLTYTKGFGDHNFTALGGFTYQEFKQESDTINGRGFSNELVRTLNSENNLITFANTTVEEWALVSFIGRINYSFRNKYFLTATLRSDGSSRFGEKNRFGTFPSISAGWAISDESFMQGISKISELKLRASYGTSGNNRIGNYAAIGLLAPSSYVFGSGNGSSVSGFNPSTIANPNLTWETTKQLDIGIELGLFDDRIFLVADYYNSRTKDLLLNVPIPTITGFASALQNLGEVRNRGWEFALNTRNFVGDFQWSTNFNISFNQNEVLRLGPEGDPLITGAVRGGTHITQIGSELAAFYLLIQDGIFQTQEEIDNSPTWNISRGTWPGDVRYRDVNGDGEITADDRTVVGSNQPDFIWGITNTFSYKNFDLTIVADGIQGNEVFNIAGRFLTNLEGNQNQAASALNRWRSVDQPGDGVTPRANRVTSGNNNIESTRWLEDGSFIRIQNVTLGYNFSPEVIQNSPFSSLRLYGAVSNLAYFTEYTGYNPEVSLEGGDPLSPGEDYGSYPLSRRFTIGVKVGF